MMTLSGSLSPFVSHVLHTLSMLVVSPCSHTANLLKDFGAILTFSKDRSAESYECMIII